MREVEFFFAVKALVLHVADHLRVVGTRLGDDPLSPWFVEKQVMHQRRQPTRHFVRATVLLLPHQHVNATVVIVGIVERRDAIFLGPIGFEIGKWLIVETADQGQRVRIGVEFAEVFAMLFETALFVPETGDSRVVLPAIEARQVVFDLDRAQEIQAPRRASKRR